MKNIIKILAIAFLSLGSLEAKSGGGGFSSSSRSSSSSSSSSRPSSSTPSRPSSSWGSSSSSSSKPSNPASTWSSSSSSTSKPNVAPAPSKPMWGSKPQTSTRPVSAVEKQRYETAVKSGKTFKTRDAAVADFKTKEASKYTSRYASEPSSRPDYIPQRYNGRDVVYNQQGGGYGYYSGGGPGLGTFIMYDMMSDAVMMNSMMARQNYYVGGPPQPQVIYTPGTGMGFWGWFSILLISGFFIAVLVLVFRNI